jgi:hypothetical protein
MDGNTIMTELILNGILQIEEADEEGILMSLDWDRLYEYDPEVYLYLRTAELNGQMIQ